MSDTAQFALLLGIVVAGGLLIYAASKCETPCPLDRFPKRIGRVVRYVFKRTTPEQRRKADEDFRQHRGGGPR